MDLPALGGGATGERRVVHPGVGRLVLPAVRDIPGSEREIGVITPTTVKRVVKNRVRQAIKLILVIHDILPCCLPEERITDNPRKH
ncbi:hypothetical protein GCM10022252_71280 [Streptosporangium oxazolinicum]|uniref:Uncharacterized protein n=1 Tax=Streptosporangium oxazolinicum TaxID=909287 RepID=A0ABP8BI74_9ACTN